MIAFSRDQSALLGEGGSLRVLTDDVITYKLAMLLEGECGGLGPTAAARNRRWLTRLVRRPQPQRDERR